MKSIRTLVACGVGATVMMMGGGVTRVLALSPVQLLAGPIERQAQRITPENPIPRRVHFEAPEYPTDAAPARARGTATLMITVDPQGQVVEARRTRLLLIASTPAISMTLAGGTAEDQARLMGSGLEHADTIRSLAKSLTDSAIRSVMLWRYDPPASGPIAFPVTISVAPEGEAGNSTTSETLRIASTDIAPVRVGGNISAPAKIRHVAPMYPPEAQAAKVTGMVIIEATIGVDGRVTDAKVLRSVPLLDQAAVDAVMQWEFTPTLLNGVPVPVIMTVTVNFTLT